MSPYSARCGANCTPIRTGLTKAAHLAPDKTLDHRPHQVHAAHELHPRPVPAGRAAPTCWGSGRPPSTSNEPLGLWLPGIPVRAAEVAASLSVPPSTECAPWVEYTSAPPHVLYRDGDGVGEPARDDLGTDVVGRAAARTRRRQPAGRRRQPTDPAIAGKDVPGDKPGGGWEHAWADHTLHHTRVGRSPLSDNNHLSCARDGIRTRMPVRAARFKLAASAVPPPGLRTEGTSYW